MAPISVTHPHLIWGMGDLLGKVFSKAGIDAGFAAFFNLMPDVDLDEIRRVGNDVWGTDLEKRGAVVGALDQVADALPRIVDDLGDGWQDSKAFNEFKAHMDVDKAFYEKAAKIAQNVGQALVDFADAADAALADKLAGLVGVVGAIIGSVVGPSGTIAGALVGLAVGVAAAYFGVLLPKVGTALQAMDDLGDQLPPDHDS